MTEDVIQVNLIDESVVKNLVQEGYEGKCAVFTDTPPSEVIAILPNVKEAERVACWANSYQIGGYGQVKIIETFGDCTHKDANEWLES